MAARSRNSATTIVFYTILQLPGCTLPFLVNENIFLLLTLTVLKKEILLLNSQTLCITTSLTVTFPCGPHHVYPSVRTRKAAFSNYRFNFIQNKTKHLFLCDSAQRKLSLQKN